MYEEIADRMGCTVAQLKAAANDYIREDYEAQEREREIRKAAFFRFSGESSKNKWFMRSAVYGRAFKDGDCSNIDKFDEIADGMKEHFPELGDDPSSRLYEIMSVPYRGKLSLGQAVEVLADMYC